MNRHWRDHEKTREIMKSTHIFIAIAANATRDSLFLLLNKKIRLPFPVGLENISRLWRRRVYSNFLISSLEQVFVRRQR